MLHVDPAHFANVINAVQRTGSLTGGAVRGLPGGAVVEGLKGINSFGSDINDAKKEFELGRVRTALERIKQIESQFNGIAGRWNGTVGSLISSARQGRQQLSLQKLNELKNAQTKMQQLTGPASKAFQDLVAALEHAVSIDGRETKGDATLADVGEPTNTDDQDTPAVGSVLDANKETTPDPDLLGRFATDYRYGPKLQLKLNSDEKAKVVPSLEKNKLYFFAGLDPPRVVRLRKLDSKAVLVFDTLHSRDSLIDSRELVELIKKGIWALV